jgi:hypothetical protein
MRWLPAAALVLVLAAFLPTLRFGFVNWDDNFHVYRNPAVTGDGAVSLRDRLLTAGLGYPIPVTVASYRLEHAVAGLRPGVFHATNLALHLLSCLAVFLLGRRLGLGTTGATVALVLFGLHPVVAEPVSWISGRKDLLAAALALYASLAFWRSLDRAHAHPRAWRWGATLLFAAATLAKPTVLLLPLFWALLHLRERQEGVRAAAVAVLPAALIAAAVAALGFAGQQRLGAVASLSAGAWLRQLWYALGYHLGLALFVQAPLAKHIPLSMPPPFAAAVDLLPLLVAALSVLVARALPVERRRLAGLGLAWAALAYLPAANIVPLNRFLADSYVYLPLVGLAWAAGALLESRLPARVTAAIGLAGGVALLALTLNASARWRNGVELWSSVWAAYPDSAQVCRDLGTALNEAGNAPAALAHYQACARWFGPALFEKNIAITLVILGRTAEAIPLFRRLAAEHPEDPVVQGYWRRLAPGP